MSRIYEDEDEDEDGENVESQESIGPNTSGIRGSETREGGLEEGEDSDTFPLPLRRRKADLKRKR